jgi:hypothetical protein
MSIRNYLPHKKFLIIFFSIILVVGIIIFVRHRYHKTTTIKNYSVLTPTQKIAFQDIVNRDSDDDGIADWEEALWGTDSLKTDTNNDGESDFDFIMKKKDKLEKENGGSQDETLNETDVFAQELFATIISLKESGSLTTDNLDTISKKLAGSVGEKKELPDIYFIDGLKVKSNPSQKDRLAYNTQLQKLIKKYEDKNLGEELAVFGKISEDETGRELEPLRETAKGYLDFSLDFSKVEVPADIALTHLAIINGMQKTGTALSNMLYLYENPLVGLIGVSQYSTYNKKLEEDMETLGDYLKNNDIL